MTVQQERGLAAISSALKSAPYQRIAYKEFRALRDRFQYLMLLFLAGYNETPPPPPPGARCVAFGDPLASFA